MCSKLATEPCLKNVINPIQVNMFWWVQVVLFARIMSSTMFTDKLVDFQFLLSRRKIEKNVLITQMFIKSIH